MKRNKAFKPKSGAQSVQRKPAAAPGKYSSERRSFDSKRSPSKGPAGRSSSPGRRGPASAGWSSDRVNSESRGPSAGRSRSGEGRPERREGSSEWKSDERRGPSAGRGRPASAGWSSDRERPAGRGPSASRGRSGEGRPERREGSSEWKSDERRGPSAGRERPKDNVWGSEYKRPLQESRPRSFEKEAPRVASTRKPVDASPSKPQYVAHHGQMIMGRNCVREVLIHSPARLVRVYTSKEEGDELLDQLKAANIEVVVMKKDQLNAMMDSESHQNFVAQVRPRPELCTEDYLVETKDKDLVLALDSISDPQNLGAILRAAECFGVGAVMWSKNRGVEVTPVVTKVSVGASELVCLLKVSNLVEELKKFSDAGYSIVTAEVNDEAVSLFDFDFPQKTVLVMGSEGEGIRKLLSTQADFRVYVPMAGKIDSLNVSQATSVLLSYWKAS